MSTNNALKLSTIPWQSPGRAGEWLNFYATNWADPQAITVTGQNDMLNDGTQAFVISAIINTSDVNYRHLRVVPLTLSNLEGVTTTDDPPIPIGTPRNIPLIIYGDAILDKNLINLVSGLYKTTGIKPINDILHGLDGNDTIYGGKLQDKLSGGVGDDALYGENDEDHLYGETGNDALFGGSGIDTLDGGAGNDVLNGGDDDLAVDVLIGGEGNDTYYLGYGVLDIINDNGLSTDVDTVIMPYQLTQWTLSASIENCTIADGTSSSRCIGNANNNALTGNAGKNTLSGEAGNDSLSGGLGNDILIGGEGNDTVSAGEGNDQIVGGNGLGDDDYFGDNGTDTIKYTSAITSITVDLNTGTSTGNEIGTDQLHGIENVIGGQAGDVLTGNAGNNVLDGYTGNDTLTGGGGNNTLIGGLGNDSYFLDKATDVVSETSKLATERDTVNCPLSYSLGNNLENLVLTGSLASNGTGNTLNNTLTGNANNNSLSGGSGQDLLIGGLGADSLSGGLDADRFRLNSTVDSGISTASRDSILDFNPAQGDKIDLSVLDANSAITGDNAFTTPMVGGLFSGLFTSQGRLYFDTTSHILYGNNDADNQADFSILLVGQNGLSAFSLIL
ncbi:MAG: calcium-binding protein [Methylovulum sp.]|jgi:Ca2+-binding RTX toxin-like protein|nr:calcium-binding protein [Methylovulum sp.]MCF7998641.1 calcium-binding protein [Methylovulum sp.]